MKKNLRKMLMMIPLAGQIICLVHIQSLEGELEKERNPSFEQAKKRLNTKILFSDMDFSEVLPRIEYWPTWKDALNHTYKFFSNGDVSIITNTSMKDNLYIGVWKEDDKRQGSLIKSTTHLITASSLELQASLPKLGRYVAIIVYRGVNLYFAFEVEER